MNPGTKQEWLDNAHDSNSDFYLAKKIDVTIKTLADFQPASDVIKWFDIPLECRYNILDFGAGMLRNTVGLLEEYPDCFVTAYDISLNSMARGIRHFNHRLQKHRKRWTITDDFDKGVNFPGYSRYQRVPDKPQFGAIVCILVLQHIDPEPLKEILYTFTGLTDCLCVFGRNALDDLEVCPHAWTKKWPIIQNFWEPTRAWYSEDFKTAGAHNGCIFRRKNR